MSDGGWVILRTAGQRTLPLAVSLNTSGVAAWTPTVMVKRRIPRRPGRAEVAAPLMPTFVFAPAAALQCLRGWSRSPVSPHPSFSIFRYDGGIPVIRDEEVERLRAVERASVPARRRRTVRAGTEVRPSEGPYAGLTGIVKSSNGKWTLVTFGGWMEVKIDTFLLAKD